MSIHRCPTCGLHYLHRASLEYHLWEDHQASTPGLVPPVNGVMSDG